MLVFLLKLQFVGVSRANLKEKEPDVFTLRFLKQEFQRNWPNRLESYINNIKVNPTQKDTKLFIITQGMQDRFGAKSADWLAG